MPVDTYLIPNASSVNTLQLMKIAVTIGVSFVDAALIAFLLLRRERRNKVGGRTNRFPTRLLAVTFILTFAVVIASACVGLYIGFTVKDQSTDFTRNASYALYASLITLITLPITWLFSFRAINQWRTEMESNKNKLAANERELQRFIGEMDMARTAAEKARTAAEAANAAKSDFLANMSHEIRTPMNGLLGMARLLMGTELNAEQHDWVEIIQNSGDNLLSIINDILDFSKIEAGRLKLEAASFDLFAAMAEVTDMLVMRAQEKNIDLFVRISPHVPRFVMGDATRLKQVVLNLMTNAIKFTEKGHVLLNICAHDIGNDKEALIQISVEDTGIGIAADKINYVFEKFTQAEESTTRRFGGTGLGLAISRRLVALMGGDISVESKIGAGSVFTFLIPLPLVENHGASKVPPVSLAGRRMLIVCDHPIKRGILADYMKNWEVDGEFCHMENEPLQALLAAAESGRPFDFVFVDRNASVQKLMQLVQRAHIFPEIQDTMFVVAATLGSAMASKVLNSVEIGALLSKPLFPDQLHSALRILWDAKQNNRKIGLITRSLISHYENGNQNQTNAGLSFHGIKVLVVEDMKVNQLLMAKIMEKFGCHTEFAVNGLEAIDKMQGVQYDIVFMDCQMPVLDGFEATRRIRLAEAEMARHTVIVALTADAMTGDREKCLSAGMDDYLNKPFKPEQISDMLKKWIVKQA